MKFFLTGYLLFAFLCTDLLGQSNVGVNAPGIKWNQIDSEDYQVIFPETRFRDAYRVANVLDYILSHDSLTLSHPRVKVPIILQNQTLIPNGFVSIAPWRSEYNLNPPQFQFNGITPWMDMLTIHEYRHVQQVANARSGTAGKFLRIVFGQGGWAFYNRAVMPRWFLEGDAVYAETVYSKGGRGRTPDFEKAYRALRVNGFRYDYEKATSGSFRDFVPSHYDLGYYMTTFARRQYETRVWDEILTSAYSKPGLYRFSKAIRGATGSSSKELYGRTMSDLDRWWGQQDAGINPLKDRLISQDPHDVYTNYRFPNYVTGSSLIVQKSSLSQIRTVYNLEDGVERKLFQPGISLNEHYSIGGGKLAWSEIRFHPRWSGEDYGIIRIYDFSTGKLHQITGKSKLMAPGLSPDGEMVAAVESSVDGKVSLLIMQVASGEEQHRAEIPEGEYISFPRWNDDNRTIFVAGRNLQGNFIKSYDVPTRTWKDLLTLMDYSIDRIFPNGKFVFFSSSMTGVQNIFALDTSTAEIFQVTNSRFGAFDPAVSPDGKKLAYSDYSAMGFRTKELLLTDALWRQPVNALDQGSNYFRELMPREPGDITEKIPDQQHNISRFNYFTKGLLNIHSWYPYVTTEEFGIGVLSRNIMNSLAISGQFTYNTNENSWKTVLGSSYGPFFPILDFEISTGERQSSQMISATDSLRLYVGRWKEHAFAAGLRVPLNITHGNYPSSVSLSSKYRHYIVDYLDGITDGSRDGNFGAVDIDFSFQRAQTRALQNIYPRWAQSLSLNYQHTLGETENYGEIFTVNSSLFFPGAFRNHSLFITGGFQSEEIINAYRFEDIFTNARGYESFPFENVYRISGNYSLPIWYPDLSMGSLAFFQRLRTNFFYDYSKGTLLDVDTELKSYGVELVLDFRLIRLIEVGAGVRLGQKIDVSDFFAEFFISSIRF